MSRTVKGKKPVGWDYWGKRPIGGGSQGARNKRVGIKIERAKLKQATRKAQREPD
jgi:hypothetical protein